MRAENDHQTISSVEINGVKTQVKIIVPKTYTNGIVLYGSVLSFTKDKIHNLKKTRTGVGRFSYDCDCEAKFFRRVPVCKHIAAFTLVERGLRYDTR